MTESQKKSGLRQHPPELMARYGKNPYGENMYRLVYGPSRLHLLGNKTEGYHWYPLYSELNEVWVLERWLTAQEFTQCSKERWERDPALNILGPYPSRGEYQSAHIFHVVPPEDINLDKLIMLIEEGWTRGYEEHRDACKAKYAAEEKDKDRQMLDIALDSAPAFGVAAMSGGLVSRGTKDYPDTYTAEELNLPIGNNKFVSLGTEHA